MEGQRVKPKPHCEVVRGVAWTHVEERGLPGTARAHDAEELLGLGGARHRVQKRLALSLGSRREHEIDVCPLEVDGGLLGSVLEVATTGVCDSGFVYILLQFQELLGADILGDKLWHSDGLDR